VQAAISKGADVSATNDDGWTPLMMAAYSNKNPEVITVLLKAGANLSAGNRYGVTALILAASANQNPEVLVTLLKAGADAKAHDVTGATALYAAQDNEKLKGTAALRQLEEASK
jgi:uncharacterized protein